MTPQYLFVVWRWDHLQDSLQPFEIVPVADATAEKQLVCIHQRVGVDVLVELVSERLSENAEAIVLLHKEHFGHSDVEYFRQKITGDQVKAITTFGNGIGFIYYNAEQKTGLINESRVGGLAHGRIFKGGHQPDLLNVHGELYSDCFHQVWRHYRYQVKRRLYETNEMLNRFLGPNLEAEDFNGNALQLLSHHQPDLIHALDSCKTILLTDYDKDNDVQDAVTGCWNVLSNHYLRHEGDLIPLNRQFDKLLSSIKEHDY